MSLKIDEKGQVKNEVSRKKEEKLKIFVGNSPSIMVDGSVPVSSSDS
jgi:hypothetical protein